MPLTDEQIDMLIERRMGIANWLNEFAPYVTGDQKHLDENTSERAYWAYGYQKAIDDVVRLAGRMSEK